MRRPFAAIAALKNLQVTAHDSPEVVYFLATLYMHVRFWSDAEALLAELQVAVPGRAVLVFDRATCLIELGRMDEAKRLLDDAAPEVGERFPKKVLWARIAVATGDTATGEELLAAAIRCDPAAAAMAAELPDLAPMLKLLELSPDSISRMKCSLLVSSENLDLGSI